MGWFVRNRTMQLRAGGASRTKAIDVLSVLWIAWALLLCLAMQSMVGGGTLRGGGFGFVDAPESKGGALRFAASVCLGTVEKFLADGLSSP